MSDRALVLATGVAALLLTVAQYVVPATPLFHDWRYAAALTIVALPLARAVLRDRTRLRAAAAGALIVAGAGLWSGLAGADTETIAGAPGTTVPVPALHLSVAFGPATDAALAGGSATITVRRDGDAFVLGPGATHIVGANVVFTQPHVAARIVVHDDRGNRLTVTQPSNASFLSDVLLFRTEQPIGDQRFPLDVFATPAQHRVVRALAFTPAQLAAFRHETGLQEPGLVLSAADDGGRPVGIALAPSGRETAVGGLRVRAILGRYPTLGVASAPHPLAAGLGGMLFVAGAVWSARSGLRAPRAVLDPDLT